jgi:hypothetical protein
MTKRQRRRWRRLEMTKASSTAKPEPPASPNGQAVPERKQATAPEQERPQKQAPERERSDS